MKNELHIKFGKRVRELRKERGWSQEEFADRCGIERGVRNPTLEVIGMISSGLNVEIYILFHLTNWIYSIILKIILVYIKTKIHVKLFHLE